MHVREQGLEWCGELPEFEADGGDWTRIQRRRSRVVLVRRARALAVVAMLAAVPVAYWAGRTEAPLVVVQSASDTALVEARTPELASNEGVRLLEAQLARVDRELQTRYDAHASAAELEGLWRSRHELENALMVAYRRPAQLVAL